MKYRAKCTKIISFVDSHYNMNAYQKVRDAKDTYIEVDTPEEAELIEEINRHQEAISAATLKLLDIIEG